MRKGTWLWLSLFVAVLACTRDEPTNPVIPTNPWIQTPSSGALISSIHAPVRGRAPDADSVLIRVDSVWPSIRVPCAEDGSFSVERCRIGGHGGRVIWAQEDSIPLADHYAALFEAAYAMGPPPWPHEMDSPLFNVLSLDGLHPNGTGYALMAPAWYETITGRDDFPTLPATVAQPSLCTPPPGARRLSPREVLGAP
ncbi:MAG: hypothetical protein MUE60_07445 [Candidatus Eisenbacteria bacterium]|nr:hypothetical protein [Candidatus Eisenbacteria bacterium]